MTKLPPEPDEIEKPLTIADRQLLEELFANLYQNQIVYHERITILSKVDRVEITDNELQVWHRPIRLLFKPDARVVDDMYERWLNIGLLNCGASLGLEKFPYHYHHNGRLSGPYRTFLLWPHKELVKQISLMTDEELKTDLRKALRKTWL